MEPHKGNPNISAEQFGVLNELQPGHVISVRKVGNKNFGPKHVVTEVERDPHLMEIYHLPVNDKRKTEDKRYSRGGQNGYSHPFTKGTEHWTPIGIHGTLPQPEIQIHRK